MIGRALFVLAVLASQALPAQGPAIGQPAAEFELTLLQGGTTRLSALRGHPVLINFWASWCVPCRSEMPEIVAAYAARGPSGLEVLAVNLSDQESRGDVRRFVAEMAMTFPVALDDRGRVRRLYRLTAVPTSVFVDSAGVVRFIQPGPMTGDVLARGLAAILPER